VLQFTGAESDTPEKHQALLEVRAQVGHPCITLPAILSYRVGFPLFEYSCLTLCLVLKAFCRYDDDLDSLHYY